MRLENDEVVLYTVTDVARIFQIGRTKAYELMHANGFPSIRLNNRLYVPKDRLNYWIDRQCGKQFRY